MSVSVSGVIYFNREFKDLEEKIEFAFQVQKLGNESKIGINQGGNVQSHSRKSINFVKKEEYRGYIFEIADDPLDFNAEYIFGGYDFDLSEINEYDSFESRMKRVTFFLEKLLGIPIVKTIEIFINIDVGDEFQYIESTIDNFQKSLKEYFLKEEGWTPQLVVRVFNKD